MDAELLLKLQATQLEISKEVRRICEKHGIRYHLDSGSLLGAVRHQGFIPWDDDMDFGFLRDEYQRFLQVAPEELDEKYYLQAWDNDPSYPYPFAKVRKKGTVLSETAFRYAKTPKEVWVDLFPYDNYPDAPAVQRRQAKKINRLKKTLMMKAHATPWLMGRNLVRKVGIFVKYLPFWLAAPFCSRDSLKKKLQTASVQFNGQPTKNLHPAGSSAYGRWVIPAECFREYSVLPFADTEFSVPAGYDTYLQSAYGDYMTLPPVEKRRTHQPLEIKL